MGRTRIGMEGRKWLINGQPTYSEIPGSNPASHGLLWNQRLIQGVFDDAGNRELYSRLPMGVLDPWRNTEALVAALPQWYAYGLRAITVGFQGGWPVGMREVEDIRNNPFGEDGLIFDPAYAERMDRIIRAADEIGMVVIVNFLYWAQAKKMKDGRAIRAAVKRAANFLRDQGYTNVLIDVANEYDITLFSGHPLVNKAEGIVTLIDLAREESGGMLTASSGGGGTLDEEVARGSDFVLLHGNGLTRGQYYDLLRRAAACSPHKPILCNEDCPCCTRVDVALELYTSWGYYNNYTKQIPPCDFSVTRGEDLFFARRVARAVGIPLEPLSEEESFVLAGLAPEERFSGGLTCLRLAAEFPELVNRVTFLIDDEPVYTSYDEPFYFETVCTWLGKAFVPQPGARYGAKVYLTDGRVIHKRA